MPDGLLNQFLASGTAAERAAFTPSPPSVIAGPDPLYLWFETDTGDTYSHAGGAWVKVNSGGTGALLAANNLSDLANAATARTNLDVYSKSEVDSAIAGVATPLTATFVLSSGDTGTNVTNYAIAPRAGTFSKCKVVTKASDASTDLTFTIKQNGTAVFTASNTVAHGTSAGTVSTFTNLTSSPLTVAADDLFTLDVTSGTSSWQATIQLES